MTKDRYTRSDSYDLITGGSGFLGTSLCKVLLGSGRNVISLDVKPASITHPNLTHIEVDLRESFSKLITEGKLENVYHFAGQVSSERSMLNPMDDLERNLKVSLNLLDLTNTVGVKRIFVASSMATYGKSESLPISEDNRQIPLSIYGANKLTIENYFRVLSCNPVTILRLFNLYGEGQNLEDLQQGMVSIYIKLALSGKIEVKGPLSRVRDFIHVDDAVWAILKLAELEDDNFAIYNIGSGVGTEIRRLVELIVSIFPGVEVVESAGTPGDVHESVADIKRLKSRLTSFEPRPLEDAVREKIEWARRLTSN